MGINMCAYADTHLHIQECTQKRKAVKREGLCATDLPTLRELFSCGLAFIVPRGVARTAQLGKQSIACLSYTDVVCMNRSSDYVVVATVLLL